MKKNTWIAIGILVAMGVLYLVVRQGPTTQVDAPMKIQKVNNLSRIEFERPKTNPKQITFEKQNDKWRLAKPVNADVASDVAGDFKNVFEETIQTDLHRIQDADPKEYGLDDKSGVKVRLFAKGTEQPSRQFIVGDETTISKTGATRTYIKKPEEPTIYRAQIQMGKLVRKKLEEFRSKSIVELDPKNLTSFQINSPDKDKILLSKKDGTWKFGDTDVGFEPSKKQVKAYLQKLSPLEATGFIDDKKPEDVGLSQPKRTISFKDKDGEKTDLKMGWFSKKEQKVYVAKRPDNPHIFKIDKETAEDLDADYSSFRTRVPTPVEGPISKLIFHGSTPITLERKDDSWQLTQPSKKIDLNTGKVKSLARSLSNLKAESYAQANKPELKKRVTVVTQKGKHQLWIGSKASGSTETVYAKYGKSPLFTLKEFEADRFKLTIDDLKKPEKPASKPAMKGGPPTMRGGPPGMRGGGGKKQMPQSVRKKLRRKLQQKAGGQ